MLACIQRRQNLSSQRLACKPKGLDAPPPPPLQARPHKGDPASVISRYPSPAELDAFAQKTAGAPLSIKIFPSDVRVPQHKQLNKTVNGFDTTGQRFGSYAHPYSGGYQGLLAIVKASVATKGVVKNSEGRRTKHANAQSSAAPYNNALNNGYAVRHGHKAYHISSCKPPHVPIETLCSNAGMASGDQSRAPQSELAEVHSLIRQMSRVPHSQALQLGGEARASPSLQAVAAVAHSDSDFVLGVPPQSSLAAAAAAAASQGADAAAGGYALWQHKHHVQQYQQGAGRPYGVRASPETSLPPAYGAGAASLAVQDFSAGHYLASLWDSVVSTPSNDCYTSQVLATGTRAAGPRDMGPPHPHVPTSHHPLQLHPLPPPHAPAFGADLAPCCGLPGSSLCHAAVLSSSLQSLECLISEIQPPCIKERMLGRGYEAMGMPPLLEHHQHTHVQLPVYR
ncbi:protein FAM222A-like [Betta splendens]|uniref:Protein FAM222A-like n=1 Tax=Betta splendens TaxID=158456 RepID=A0A6P7P633_BETSP|nr:protein FAM222A-like [Betta splendens]XP_029025518.1 protein FAM222A-like [Betta splendens]XP_029025519.1 protein FAM222A-like [Betta splendens]XP_055369630.1 protein FAM222A-like [Betta splendens]